MAQLGTQPLPQWLLTRGVEERRPELVVLPCSPWQTSFESVVFLVGEHGSLSATTATRLGQQDSMPPVSLAFARPAKDLARSLKDVSSSLLVPMLFPLLHLIAFYRRLCFSHRTVFCFSLSLSCVVLVHHSLFLILARHSLRHHRDSSTRSGIYSFFDFYSALLFGSAPLLTPRIALFTTSNSRALYHVRIRNQAISGWTIRRYYDKSTDELRHQWTSWFTSERCPPRCWHWRRLSWLVRPQ